MFLGNCYSHILHNSVKHAHRVLTIDIEQILLSMYAHFSRSAKRISELKQYYEFYEQDFKVRIILLIIPNNVLRQLIIFYFIVGNSETYQNQMVEFILIYRTFS